MAQSWLHQYARLALPNSLFTIKYTRLRLGRDPRSEQLLEGPYLTRSNCTLTDHQQLAIRQRQLIDSNHLTPRP
jgi:hypothetical protein